MVEYAGEAPGGSHYFWDSEDGTVPARWAVRTEWCLRCNGGGNIAYNRGRRDRSKGVSKQRRNTGQREGCEEVVSGVRQQQSPDKSCKLFEEFGLFLRLTVTFKQWGEMFNCSL